MIPIPTNNKQYELIFSCWLSKSQSWKTAMTLLNIIEKTGLDDPVTIVAMQPIKIKSHSGLFNASIRARLGSFDFVY